MTAATPDNEATRAALALPTREAAAALGIHQGSVHRLRKRLRVASPVEAPMPVLVLRVPVELREALDREAAFLRAPVAEVAREWLAHGEALAWTALDTIHAGGNVRTMAGAGVAECGAEYVRFIGPKHPAWPGVTCPGCRVALGMGER